MKERVKTCIKLIYDIFEGIQRPLEDICTLTESIYIPKGINTPALDRSKKWEFEPYGRIRVRGEAPTVVIG